MLVSINWIKDYVELDRWPSNSEFCEKMIMTGSNIETTQRLSEGISGVRIGRIAKTEKHPDADRLTVCQVDMGTETVQIVTGAANIYEGAFVPVAVDGAHVPALHGAPYEPNGFDIKAGELRGVKSEGMMCGPQELGLSDKVAPFISKDGIWLLPGDWSDKLGHDVVSALELSDEVVDFEITPNRPDCLSMIGMAREAAATFGGRLIYPDTECERTDEAASDYISVEVGSDLCRRYTARVIKDVKIGQSPWWLQKRLIAAGMRPINNMVDITNFVMLEYGQPIHAFDIRHLEGNKIKVDTAVEGESFTTLDGVERRLEGDMLMINDAEKPVAIAGVMGGLNSEILPDTDTVVIESANFSGSSVRQTSKKLGLRTEASGRYEKGIDPNLCEAAADRVCRLVELLGCGRVLSGSVDVYRRPEAAPAVTARVSRINKVLGTNLTRDHMVRLLQSLEMEVSGDGDDLIVTPPSGRRDLPEEVDYVEEIARMYGYDNLPDKIPELAANVVNSASWELRRKVRDTMCAMGADEIQTFSFISDKDFDRCGIDEDSWERDTVKIINPMGEDTAALRTILMPGMLEVLGRNRSRSREAVRAFEIGTVFSKSMLGDDKLPDESYDLSIGVYGEGESFFTLKGMTEALLDRLGIDGVSYEAESKYGLYHPGRCARIIKTTNHGEQVEIGIMGEVHPDVAENYGLEMRAYAAELFFPNLIEFASDEIHYEQLPKYPAMSRDIAMVVPEEMTVASIERVITEAGTDILRDVRLFDVYRGEQVEKDKKSVAFSLTYRHDDRTLTDKETDSVHQKVLAALREKLDVAIRDN